MAEVILPAPVKAVRVKNSEARDRLKAGRFRFYSNIADPKGTRWRGMIYACPCGCGSEGVIRFRGPDGAAIEGQHSWAWDDNERQPTLSPSIHHIGHWHGWLKAGYFTQS